MSTPTEVRYVSVRVSEELLRRLRVRVAEEGETLQSVLLTLIESYVDEEEP